MMTRLLLFSLLLFPTKLQAQENGRATALTANLMMKVVHVVEVRQKILLDNAKRVLGLD